MTRAELLRFMREEARRWGQRELEEKDEPTARQMRAYAHVWGMAAGMLERMDDHAPRTGQSVVLVGVRAYDRSSDDIERYGEEEDE
jgi:hypothetical protein